MSIIVKPIVGKFIQNFYLFLLNDIRKKFKCVFSEDGYNIIKTLVINTILTTIL